jgi:hypothetical protein
MGSLTPGALQFSSVQFSSVQFNAVQQYLPRLGSYSFGAHIERLEAVLGREYSMGKPDYFF